MKTKFIPIFQIGRKEFHMKWISGFDKLLIQDRNINEFHRLSIEDLKKYKEYIDNESSFVGGILEKKEKELKRIKGED